MMRFSSVKTSLHQALELGLQVTQKDDEIFISQDKHVDEILKKFGFLTVKTTSTPMETSKPLMKDENAENVNVHLYRSMIGSLMYLTSPDIMFAVCACARFQVTHKVLHLHVVKRIFRYLKGHPKLGLWYPKDSSFDLEAYTNSDYVGASLDRQSTTGEYVAIANCYGQIIDFRNANPIKYALTVNHTIYTSCIEQFWVTAKAKNINGEAQIHVKVDGKKVIISEATFRRDLKFKDEGGVICISNEVIFEKLPLTGSTMASAIICLATNQKLNFSKYIFDNMVKHLDSETKFLMYLRLMQDVLDKQVDGMSKHNTIYVIPSHIKMVFSNMRRVGNDFLEGERKPRKGKNWIKTGQKREACRSQEKFKAVAVERGRKTKENKKRMVKNAYTVKKLCKFKEKKKREGPYVQYQESTATWT
nr:hypothetical protein [Tanacetum cinerariifolium]